MKFNADGFFRHLTEAKLAPVYLIEGNEPLLVEEALDALHLSLKNQGFSERVRVNVETGFNVADLEGLTQNFSLFAERKRVELVCTDKIPAELNQWLADYCVNVNNYADMCLIVRTPKLGAAEKKAKWVAEFEKVGGLLTIYEVELQDFPRWLDSRLLREKLKLTSDARAALIEQTEGNLLAAGQIIKKLALLQGVEPLNLSALEPLLAEDARYDLFDLAKHVLLGDLKRSLRILEHLMHEAEPVLVLWVLSKELKVLLTLQSQKGRTPLPELYRKLQIWDKRIKEVEMGLRRLSATQLADLLAFCAEIDFAIKGLKEEDSWGMLKHLVVKMAS